MKFGTDSPVGIVGMRIIDDGNLSTQPNEAQRRMPRRQHSEQHLLDRANPDIGKEGFAPIIFNPHRTLRSGRLVCWIRRVPITTCNKSANTVPGTFIQHSPTLRECKRWRGTRLEEAEVYRFKALVHRIGGRQSRQGKEEAVRPPLPHQPMRKHKCGLRLAGRRHIFNDEQGGAIGQTHTLGRALQRCRFRDRCEERTGATVRRRPCRNNGSFLTGALRGRNRVIVPIAAEMPNLVERDEREAALR